MEDLLALGTLRRVILPKGHRENILPSQFVLAIKHESGKDVFKARFNLGGHRDKEKVRTMHSSTAISQTSVGLLLALSIMFGFTVWMTGLAQAY